MIFPFPRCLRRPFDSDPGLSVADSMFSAPGQAFYMKGTHGGKTKNDGVDLVYPERAFCEAASPVSGAKYRAAGYQPKGIARNLLSSSSTSCS